MLERQETSGNGVGTGVAVLGGPWGKRESWTFYIMTDGGVLLDGDYVTRQVQLSRRFSIKLSRETRNLKRDRKTGGRTNNLTYC